MGKNKSTVHLSDHAETERIHGICIHWNEARNFGIVRSDDGVEYFASREQIKGNAIGQQVLENGERISFEAGSRSTNCPRPSATNIIPLNRPIFEKTPADYRETVLLEKWEGFSGFCRRGIDGGIGGTLILSGHDIITEGVETLRAGKSKLYVGVAPPLPGKTYWRAVCAEVCLPESPNSHSDLVAMLHNPGTTWEREFERVTRFV